MTSLYVVIVICTAFFGEAVFGFGGGLLSVPLLSVLLGVKTAVPLVLIFQTLLGLLIFHTFKLTEWKIVKPALLAILVGAAFGTLSLVYLDEKVLRQVLAAAIILYLSKELFFPNVRVLPGRQDILGALAGALGGWLQGIIGTGGPPVVMYLNELRLDKDVFRANIIVLLFIANVVCAITAFVNGLFTNEVGRYALYALPLFFVALYAGHRVHFKVSAGLYRRAIYGVLFCSATMLFLNAN